MEDYKSMLLRNRLLQPGHLSWSVIGVFVTSILVTLLFWMIFPASFQTNEYNDYTAIYEPVARNILAGKGITRTDGAPAIMTPPGYSIFLAGIFGVSTLLSLDEEHVLSVSILVGMALASVLLFLISRMAWGLLPPLVSSLVWITYPFALWLMRQPNSETPFLVVLWGGFYLFCYTLFHKKLVWPFYFLTGLMAGCAMLIRPIAIGLGFVMALILWFANREVTMCMRLFLATMLLFGNLVVILPWQLWVYSNTGKVVFLSSVGPLSILDGLTFAVRSNNYRHKIEVPQDVALLMQDLSDRIEEIQSFSMILSVMCRELQARPLAVGKLLIIKLLRSWYGTDTHRYETPSMIIQLGYSVLLLCATIVAWMQRGIARQLTVIVWLVVLYFWAMTILVVPLLRYMVPAIGLLFVLVPALLMRRGSETVQSL